MNDNALPSVASEDPFLNAPIRLGCVHCDRYDFDHVVRIPESWHEVVPVREWIDENLVLAWETHLGVCPECHELFERCDAPDPGPPPWEETEEEKNKEYRRFSNVHPIVRQIVNRDCRVSSKAKSVVQHVISKLRNGTQALRAMSPYERRQLIEDCLVQHRHNWKEYVEVMSGLRPIRCALRTRPPYATNYT